MTLLRLIFMLMIVLGIIGCRPPQTLTEAEAARIARHAMQRNGHSLVDFRVPEVMPAKNGFAIFFLPHVLVTGGDFMVLVDAETGKAELSQGK